MGWGRRLIPRQRWLQIRCLLLFDGAGAFPAVLPEFQSVPVHTRAGAEGCVPAIDRVDVRFHADVLALFRVGVLPAC